MRKTFLLAIPLLMAGCLWKHGGTLGPPAQGPGRAAPGAVRQTGGMLGRKVVTSKEEPNKLIAGDGNTCLVPEKQFRETVVGTNATCLWEKN